MKHEEHSESEHFRASIRQLSHQLQRLHQLVVGGRASTQRNEDNLDALIAQANQDLQELAAEFQNIRENNTGSSRRELSLAAEIASLEDTLLQRDFRIQQLSATQGKEGLEIARLNNLLASTQQNSKPADDFHRMYLRAESLRKALVFQKKYLLV